MSIVLMGSTSGSITLSEPAVAGSNTISLPAATGTAMVSGNMPAFRAYNNANQSITASTFTKVSLQVEDFDTASAFDNTTNYRFTPQVAGYYQVSGSIFFNYAGADGNVSRVLIYKNGTAYSISYNQINFSYGPLGPINITDLIYLNGTTDYIELYGWTNNASPSFSSSSTGTRFAAVLVRSA